MGRNRHKHHDDVIRDYEAGLSFPQIAERYGLSRSSVTSIVRRWKKSHPNRNASGLRLNGEMLAALAEYLRRNPESTLAHLQSKCEDGAIPISLATLHRTVRDLGFKWIDRCYIEHHKEEIEKNTLGESETNAGRSRDAFEKMFSYPAELTELEFDSFHDLPAPTTRLGLELALESIEELARQAMPPPRELHNVQAYVADNPVDEGGYLLPVDNLLNAFASEVNKTVHSRREREVWEWRFAHGIIASFDQLRRVYRYALVPRRCDAFQSILNALITIAALSRGYRDFFQWMDDVADRERSKSRARSLGGQLRWDLKYRSRYSRIVHECAALVRDEHPDIDNRKLASRIQADVEIGIEEEDWGKFPQPAADLRTIKNYLDRGPRSFEKDELYDSPW